MSTTLQTVCLWTLLLAHPFAHAEELPADKAETFRGYLKDSNHVILVCEVQKTAKLAEKPGTYHEVHVSATVVRTIKGKGKVGDRIRYHILCEDRIPAEALKVGGLTFLMLEEYRFDEFLLGTGDGWRYTPDLDILLARILQEPSK